MNNVKKYLIGLFGGGIIVAKTCAVEERVLIKAATEGEVIAIAGSKAGTKAEATAISKSKVLNSANVVPKKKKLLSTEKIDHLLNFIPDEEIFITSTNRILREVLQEENKEPLIHDFAVKYTDKKYDWNDICKIIKSDLGGQIKLDYRFRNMVLLQYSNTYFENFCRSYIENTKITKMQCIKIREIALLRGFQENSDLLNMIDKSIKLKEK